MRQGEALGVVDGVDGIEIVGGADHGARQKAGRGGESLHGLGDRHGDRGGVDRRTRRGGRPVHSVVNDRFGRGVRYRQSLRAGIGPAGQREHRIRRVLSRRVGGGDRRALHEIRLAGDRADRLVRGDGDGSGVGRRADRRRRPVGGVVNLRAGGRVGDSDLQGPGEHLRGRIEGRRRDRGRAQQSVDGELPVAAHIDLPIGHCRGGELHRLAGGVARRVGIALIENVRQVGRVVGEEDGRGLIDIDVGFQRPRDRAAGAVGGNRRRRARVGEQLGARARRRGRHLPVHEGVGIEGAALPGTDGGVLRPAEVKIVVPVRRRSPDSLAPVVRPELRRLELLDDLIGAIESAQVVPVEDMNQAVFPHLHQRGEGLARGQRLLGEQHRAPGAQVAVAAVQLRLVPRSELVLDGHDPAAHAVSHGVGIGGGGRIAAVPGHDEHSAVGIGGVVHLGRQTGAAHPDAAAAAVRAGAVDIDLLQRRGVVREDPPMPRPVVAHRTESDINDAVEQEKARALVMERRVEGQNPSAAPAAGAGHRPLDHDGGAELLGAGGDIESVQPKDVAGALGLGAGQIHGVGRQIYDRSSEDAQVQPVGSGRGGVGQQGHRP